eukprot:1189297-Prorocentrum_minimum.AAC.5
MAAWWAASAVSPHPSACGRWRFSDFPTTGDGSQTCHPPGRSLSQLRTRHSFPHQLRIPCLCPEDDASNVKKGCIRREESSASYISSLAVTCPKNIV